MLFDYLLKQNNISGKSTGMKDEHTPNVAAAIAAGTARAGLGILSAARAFGSPLSPLGGRFDPMTNLYRSPRETLLAITDPAFIGQVEARGR